MTYFSESTKLTNIAKFDIIVGSQAEVDKQLATHKINDWAAAVTDNDKIVFLDGTFYPNNDGEITVTEPGLTIQMESSDATINTDSYTFSSSGADCDVEINVSNTRNVSISLVTTNKIHKEAVGTMKMFLGETTPDGYLDADGSAISRTVYGRLYKTLVLDSAYSTEDCTFTVASPTVVTDNTHGFTGGEILQFTTTDTLPTGISLSTNYFVIYIDVNTFYISLTLGGTEVNVSGGGTGTHSYTRSLYGLGDGSTTFNLPNTQGIGITGAGSQTINGRTKGGNNVGFVDEDKGQGHYHESHIQDGRNVVSGSIDNIGWKGAALSSGIVKDPLTWFKRNTENRNTN